MRTINFEGKDVYLDKKTYLFGSPRAAPVLMPSGTHRFNFACNLPLTLPESFKAHHGSISYYVKAELDVPWNFNGEFKLEFAVVRQNDFDDFPDLKLPTHSEEIKYFCCWCCESKPLSITVTLPCSGFVPGQKIPITIEYVNKSSLEVDKTTMSLIRTIRYQW
jgi:hypothetical protein